MKEIAILIFFNKVRQEQEVVVVLVESNESNE